MPKTFVPPVMEPNSLAQGLKLLMIWSGLIFTFILSHLFTPHSQSPKTPHDFSSSCPCSYCSHCLKYLFLYNKPLLILSTLVKSPFLLPSSPLLTRPSTPRKYLLPFSLILCTRLLLQLTHCVLGVCLLILFSY